MSLVIFSFSLTHFFPFFFFYVLVSATVFDSTTGGAEVRHLQINHRMALNLVPKLGGRNLKLMTKMRAF